MTPASTAAPAAPLDSFPATPAPRRLEPVEIEITRSCRFKAKSCGLCGLPKTNRVHSPKKTATCAFKRRNGCATCGEAKGHADHLGAPESFNVMAGRDPNVYRSIIAKWAPVLTAALEASGLPRGLAGVLVEAEVSFGDGVDRDADNHRVMVSKALGDALVAGGYLESDTWARFEVGGFQRRDEPGVSRTRLLIFARA